VGTQYQDNFDQPNAVAAPHPKNDSETDLSPIREALADLLTGKHPDRKLVSRLAAAGARFGAQPSDVAEWIETFSGRRGIGFGLIIKALPEELPEFLTEKSKPKPAEPEYRKPAEPPAPPPAQIQCERCGDSGAIDLDPNKTTSRIAWCDCAAAEHLRETQPDYVTDFNRAQEEFEAKFPAKATA